MMTVDVNMMTVDVNMMTVDDQLSIAQSEATHGRSSRAGRPAKVTSQCYYNLCADLGLADAAATVHGRFK